jgi:hypothetical protein
MCRHFVNSSSENLFLKVYSYRFIESFSQSVTSPPHLLFLCPQAIDLLAIPPR